MEDYKNSCLFEFFVDAVIMEGGDGSGKLTVRFDDYKQVGDKLFNYLEQRYPNHYTKLQEKNHILITDMSNENFIVCGKSFIECIGDYEYDVEVKI